MRFEDVAPEPKEKAKAFKTDEQLAALEAREGIELSDEEPSAASGGSSWKQCGDDMVFNPRLCSTDGTST